MKTITIITLSLFSLSSYSCDNCNIYMSISPNDNQHMIGLYYRQRLMMGEYSNFGQQLMLKHASHGNNTNFWGNTITETYRTYELRAQIAEGSRFRTYFVLPFIQNTQAINGDKQFTLTGLSDPIVIQSMQIIDPNKEYKNSDFTQRLEIGLGIKFPLGTIDKEKDNTLPNLDLQAGTGSWDILGMLKYWVRIKSFGALINMNYKWNSPNNGDYKYGNTLNGTFNLFYQTKIKESTLMPIVGVNFEQAAHDVSTETHTDTGGKVLFAQGGVRAYVRQFIVFGEFQKAISNQMNGYTQLINKHKINVGVAYNF